MTMRLYWLGNVAKSRVVDEILTSNSGSRRVIVFDYGCGDGGDWPSILAAYSNLRLIGYEPYPPSYHKARERLRGVGAEILTGKDIETVAIRADYIVSFSVFEHVVHRADFLGHAKRILAPNGTFYLNYDDGHFRNLLDASRPATWMPALRALGRTVVSRPLAMMGFERHYQRRVNAHEVDHIVAKSGFRIERVDYHNLSCLKDLAKSMPASLQQRYSAWWLAVEKQLNEEFKVQLPARQFGDQCNLWRQMVSRTLCLKHK